MLIKEEVYINSSANTQYNEHPVELKPFTFKSSSPLSVVFICILWSLQACSPKSDVSATTDVPFEHGKFILNTHNKVLYSLESQNTSDFYYGLGYKQARDQRWLLFLDQLSTKGELSAYFGDEWLETDILMRAFNLQDYAADIFSHLSEDHQALLESYAKGINDATQQMGRFQDVRFSERDLEPSDWQPETSIALWLRNLILNSPNLNRALLLSAIGIQLPPNQREFIFKSIPLTDPTHSSLVQSKDLVEPLQILYTKFASIHSALSIINKRKQIVAAYFEPQNISITTHQLRKYLARPADELVIAKVFKQEHLLGIPVGIPFYSSQFNIQSKDWISLQESGPGPVSIYLSTQNPETTSSTEVFQLPDDTIKLVEISKVQQDIKLNSIFNLPSNFPLFLRITLDTKQIASLLENLLLIDPLNNAPRLSSSFHHIHKVQNNTYTTTGISSLGSQAFSSNEIIINPGLSSRNLAANKNSRPDKFVVSKENIVLTGEQRQLYNWGTEPFIMEHLQTELLLNESKQDYWALDQFNNTYSLFASRVMQEVLPNLKGQISTEKQKTAIDYFENWNYSFEANATAASLFETFYRVFLTTTLQDELGPILMQLLLKDADLHSAIGLQLLNSDSGLFDNIESEVEETKTDILLIALTEAITQLERNLGLQSKDWRWDNYLANMLSTTSRFGFSHLLHSNLLKDDTALEQGHWSSPLFWSFSNKDSSSNLSVSYSYTLKKDSLFIYFPEANNKTGKDNVLPFKL